MNFAQLRDALLALDPLDKQSDLCCLAAALAALDEDVGTLDVPVDDLVRVQVREPP